MRYQDFVLQIGPDIGGGYSVNVVRSPAGEGAGTFRLPFNGRELRQVLRGLGRSISRSDQTLVLEDGGGTEPFSPREVGETLFCALFNGKVRSLYDQSVGSTGAVPGLGLRIQLKLNPEHPDLARIYSLPWELLYRPDTQDFLSLSRMTPVVRYLDVSRPTTPLPLPSPLRILVVIASPKGLPPLDLRRERLNIEAAWGRHKGVEVIFLADATPGMIREELLDQPFHVLHFMGHGGFDSRTGEGVLFFTGSGGEALPISGQVLASKLKDFRSLRLVFLNACETACSAGEATINPFAGVASALVLGGVPAVLAMQFPISDTAAISFSKAFYQRLAAGDPVDTAVAEGRQAVHSADCGSVEWATPVLFLRTLDGTLFARTPKTVANPGAAQAAPIRPGLGLLVTAAVPKSSPWRKVLVTATSVVALIIAAAVGGRLATQDSGQMALSKGLSSLLGKADVGVAPERKSSHESRMAVRTLSGIDSYPARVARSAERGILKAYVIRQEFPVDRGLSVVVDKVEIMEDRMRWYFQYFNRSAEDWPMSRNYSRVYLADELGDRFSVMEVQDVPSLEDTYHLEVQPGLRMDQWIDFPLPHDLGAKTFTVSVIGTPFKVKMVL